MKENIKIGLLGIIAVTLTINTYLQIPSKTAVSRATQAQVSHDDHNHDKTNQLSIAPDGKSIVMGDNQAPAAYTGPTTSVNFVQTSHNYGKIKQDTKNKHIFKFTNTGSDPLIIENAVGSCGCTVPEYPKEPIAPGKTGEIVVEYSPGKQQGLQNKTVTVTANTEPKTTTLNISAEVEP